MCDACECACFGARVRVHVYGNATVRFFVCSWKITDLIRNDDDDDDDDDDDNNYIENVYSDAYNL